MTTTDVRTQSAIVDWPAQAEARAKQNGEPGWALEQRRRAAALVESLPFPSRADELWRRTDFGSLVEALPGLEVVAERDGTIQGAHELARQGVIACSMEQAMREHADKLESRLGALIETDHDRYAALHRALRSGGTFVWVPDGVTLETPIGFARRIEKPGVASFPATVVVLGREARATIIEEQRSDTAEGISFFDGGTEVFVGEGAKLVYATLQDWGRNVFHYSNARAQVERDGELQWIQTVLGGRMVKTNAYFRMAGPGAQAFVHGFMFGDARQHFDLHTLQKHLADHTTSDLLIKCCLKDRARSVYQGLIQVAEGAQRTDAYQANRNLLLSDKARADSIPGLEILANDVRCTHGATIGNVDEEPMYYLMSRGLPRNEAQRLVVEGFFAPVLDRIPLEAVREQLRAVIERKIG